MEIPVYDTGAVNAYGDGLYQGLANRESYFRVDAKKSSPAGFDLAQAPLADMTVRVTCEWLSHDGKVTWLVHRCVMFCVNVVAYVRMVFQFACIVM